MRLEVTVHQFHIPVMGIGFTIDSALRVSRLGIATVISLADDRLIERVRRHYCGLRGIACEPITAREIGRASCRERVFKDV